MTFTAGQILAISFFSALFGAGSTMMAIAIISLRRVQLAKQAKQAKANASTQVIRVSDVEKNKPDITKIFEFTGDAIIDADPDPRVRALARMTPEQRAMYDALPPGGLSHEEYNRELGIPVKVLTARPSTPETDIPVAIPAPYKSRRRAPAVSPLAGSWLSMEATNGGTYQITTIEPVTETDLINLKSIREYVPQG